MFPEYIVSVAKYGDPRFIPAGETQEYASAFAGTDVVAFQIGRVVLAGTPAEMRAWMGAMLAKLPLATAAGRDGNEMAAVDPAELTDEQYGIADRIETALKASPHGGLTISAAARQIRCDYGDAKTVLAYLVEHLYAHTSGNGAWTRYHAGRA